MEVIYESLEDGQEIDEEGKSLKIFKVVAKKDATHKHLHRHDEDPPKACSREVI